MEVFHDTAIYGVSLAIWDHTVLYLLPDTSEHTPPFTVLKSSMKVEKW